MCYLGTNIEAVCGTEVNVFRWVRGMRTKAIGWEGDTAEYQLMRQALGTSSIYNLVGNVTLYRHAHFRFQ